MRKLLNTLYVTNPDVYLTKDGENVIAKIDNQEVMRIPSLNLEGIVCFNRLGASPYLMNMCVERHIGLCFLTPSGRFLARVTGAVNGNVLLRRKQYRMADNAEASLAISKLFIAGKIFNARKIVERFKRDHVCNEQMAKQTSEVSAKLDLNRRIALKAPAADVLRGIEGEAALTYFSIFNDMIVGQKTDFTFSGRSRRPPKDKVNAMLSFVYTLLAHEVESALETVGLDPYVGFLHTDRPGRASLALDMMEEFRGYLADRLVLSLINRGQVSSSDFKEQGADSVIMTDQCKRTIVSAWQKRKKETITHPYLNTSIAIGLLPYAQAMLLTRYLRGDIDNYPVFLIQ